MKENKPREEITKEETIEETVKEKTTEEMTEEEKKAARLKKRLDTLKKKSSYSSEEWNNPYRFQTRYMEKNEVVVKSYKMKKALVDRFQEICKLQGKAQSAELSKIMIKYIKNYEKKHPTDE